MADWTTIADGVLEPGDPVRSVDALALRDNPIAIAERAVGAPNVLGTLKSVQVFTANGTWTKPSGVGHVIVEVIGAGGTGGSAVSDGGPNFEAGSGGGAGGYARKVIDVQAISTSTITVGSAPGGSSSWADGTNTVSATGGGNGAREIAIGGAGGVGSGGDVNGAGGQGEHVLSFETGGGGNGGGGIYGGGGRGQVGTNNDGEAGKGIGAGGGGARTNISGTKNGGAGTNGIVIVTEF